MYRYRILARKYWYLVGPLAAIIVLAVVIVFRPPRANVRNFDDCVRFGFPVSDSDPQTCTAYHKTYAGPYEGAVHATKSKVIHNLAFDTLATGDAPSKHPRLFQVITDQKGWAEFWTEIHKGLATEPVRLPNDFTNYDVVAVVLGPQTKQGYTIEVRSIQRSEGRVEVHLLTALPGANCSSKPILSNPYHAVRIDKLTKEEADHVSFLTDEVIRNCPTS